MRWSTCVQSLVIITLWIWQLSVATRCGSHGLHLVFGVSPAHSAHKGLREPETTQEYIALEKVLRLVNRSLEKH